jgi:biopolymer transport protein ExbB/TolQ
MNRHRRAQLFLWGIIAAAVAIWGILLPQIAQFASVQERVRKYREAGIETGAVFYSDHPAMRDIERRVDGVVNGRDTAFWELPSGR